MNTFFERVEAGLDRFFGGLSALHERMVERLFEYRYRETQKGVFGLFDHPEKICAAARAARDKGFTNFDCLTPFPVHGLEADMGLNRSRLGYVTFVAGLAGFLIAFAMQTCVHDQVIQSGPALNALPNLNSYPLNIGGKPLYSWPAMVPILFELTVLIGGLSTVAGLFLLSRIPRSSRRVLHPDITNDKFCLWIPADSAHYEEEAVKSFLAGLGAGEITVVGEDAA